MSKKWYQIWKRSDETAKSNPGYFDSLKENDSAIQGWYNMALSDDRVTSPELAMKLATVYRCVDILSGSIASLPLIYKQKNRYGVFTEVEHPELSYLLQKKANNRQSSFDLFQNAIIQMVLYGNAYIYPRYVGAERKELILFSPNTCSYDVINNVYDVNDMVNGVFEIFDADEIIHLRNISLDGGYTGISTISYGAKVLGISANADNRTSDSFKPGNMLKGFISGDGLAGVKGFGELQDNQIDDIKDKVETQINKGKNIFSLPGAAKFNQLSISSTDLQLLETRKFGVLDICRFMGVHPDKVFAGQSQNYKASAMSNEMFLSDTLQPRLSKIESELNSKLIPRRIAFKEKIEYNVEAMLTTSLEQEAIYIEKTIQNGVYTINYWRAKKGQNPIEGGDTPMISCNVAPVDSPKIRGEENNLPPKTE